MQKSLWNRRTLLQRSLQLSTGALLTGAANAPLALSQSFPLQPLPDKRFQLVVTTEAEHWKQAQVYQPSFDWTMLDLSIDPHTDTKQTMLGFGACFNELGWTSLLALSEADRESILKELFDPHAGGRFTYCRMPIGANDFATEAYSYDESDDDFELKHFSIDHDRKTLLPFLKAALSHQPELKLWASPWTPPSWMKRNHFYAEAKAWPGMKDNGIRPDQVGHEGEDFFLTEPRYLQAYARYFGKFIDAYQAEGVRIGVVMPQNEFNSAQNFPSCTWTPKSLAAFLHYLGPEMEKRHVEIYFGTMERGNPQLLAEVLADPDAARYVKGVGLQWAGKNALTAVHHQHSNLVLFQSEQECGDGKNSWSYTGYCWNLMKHYLSNGANGYMYWNISTLNGGVSSWGWPQNSLVSVNAEERTFRYNHDYYLLKHLTHFVEVGAQRLELSGTMDEALAFRNPDQSVVVLLRNEASAARRVQIHCEPTSCVVELPPDSVATLQIPAV